MRLAQRKKKLDFVKLNKRIVLPSHHHWNQQTVSARTSFENDANNQFDQTIPLSVRVSENRAVDFRNKVLNSTSLKTRNKDFLSPR